MEIRVIGLSSESAIAALESELSIVLEWSIVPGAKELWCLSESGDSLTSRASGSVLPLNRYRVETDDQLIAVNFLMAKLGLYVAVLDELRGKQVRIDLVLTPIRAVADQLMFAGNVFVYRTN